MASHVKGAKKHPDALNDYTRYHDEVMELCDGVDDDNSERVAKIIEKAYEAGKSFEQATKEVNDVTLATSVEIYQPNADKPSYFKEKQGGVDKIVNESFSHPRISIYYEDGRSVSFIALPFKITEYRNQGKPKPKETRL